MSHCHAATLSLCVSCLPSYFFNQVSQTLVISTDLTPRSPPPHTPAPPPPKALPGRMRAAPRPIPCATPRSCAGPSSTASAGATGPGGAENQDPWQWVPLHRKGSLHPRTFAPLPTAGSSTRVVVPLRPVLWYLPLSFCKRRFNLSCSFWCKMHKKSRCHLPFRLFGPNAL